MFSSSTSASRLRVCAPSFAASIAELYREASVCPYVVLGTHECLTGCHQYVARTIARASISSCRLACLLPEALPGCPQCPTNVCMPLLLLKSAPRGVPHRFTSSPSADPHIQQATGAPDARSARGGRRPFVFDVSLARFSRRSRSGVDRRRTRGARRTEMSAASDQ